MSNKNTHKHHIIPRHMGGTNDLSNLIELSVADHAEAHRLLYENHGKYEDLYAYQALSGQISSDKARREVCRQRMIANNPTNNPETVKKILESRKHYKHSEETKKNMTNASLGKRKSKEHAANIGKSHSKSYRVRTPNGETIDVVSLRQFCIANSLQEALMYKVASGTRTHHKGYNVERLF